MEREKPFSKSKWEGSAAGGTYPNRPRVPEKDEPLKQPKEYHTGKGLLRASMKSLT